jgi:DNA-binding transcriptional regulator YhcF (GntR family)
MHFTLDYHSSEPLTQQAVLQIKRLVVIGTLKPGDKLPSVRQLARELQINPTTTSRIFAQLAKEGVVIQKPGLGAFVADGPCPFSAEYIDENLSRQALVLLVEGLRFGLNYDEIVGVLQKQYHYSIASQGDAAKRL